MTTGDAAGADLLNRRAWREVTLPDDVRAVPTMLSEGELTLLYTLARDYADGRGAIVDAGCFLGGSSAALLAGLRDRQQPWHGPPLTTYDLFLVEDYTRDAYFSGQGLEIGDSFRHLYDRNVAAYADVPHVVREGDVIEHGWDGGPIDVFFIDLLKTWDVNESVQQSFFPHLIPGRSLLIHQDYGWGMLPWLHISAELMWDSLRRIDEIPFATHLFLLEREIDPQLLSLDLRRDLSSDERFALLDRAIARNEGEARGMVALSKALLLAQEGRRDAGLRLLAEVEAELAGNASIELCANQTRPLM